MRARLRLRRPSPAMAVALLALVVALGGTAEATVIITSNSQVAAGTISGAYAPSGDHGNLIAGSVGGADLRNYGVLNAKIGTNAVTSTKIKDGSIAPADLSAAAQGADAWGNFDSLGNIRAGKNIVDASSPGTGIFCIQLAPGVPAGPAVVSPDYTNDGTVPGVNTGQAVVESPSGGGNCNGTPSPNVEVVTFARSFSSGSTTLTPQGEGFELIVG